MASTISPSSKPAQSEPPPAYPQRYLRFWHGMRLGAFARLMVRNRFRVHPSRWGMVATVSIASLFNSFCFRLQRLTHGRKLAATRIEHPPVFIIGHWRSGTTLLHELLTCDEQFGYPTTYQCFAPHHFLITESLLPRLLAFMMPPRRPMDRMEAGFDRPQEDEFALCGMGAPTPYLRMAFPNHPPVHMEMLDLAEVGVADLEEFKQSLTTFIKALTYRQRKRLVLKSPPHTGRIEVLAEMFPGAKFIHIVRDPRDIYASTVRLWTALDAGHGFQIPHHRDLDAFIFEALRRMYAGFEQQRERIDPATICDIRYEELVEDPIRELEAVYSRLQLGDFERVRGKLTEYVESQKNYQTNRHRLSPDMRARIDRFCGRYLAANGYAKGEGGLSLAEG